MNASIKKLLLSGVAAGLMFPVMPAMAQDTQDNAAVAQDNNEAQAGGDIVVTARRRAESILRVPVVANVLQAEQLDQYAAGDLAAISSHVPGLNIGSTTSSFGSQVALRGIGTTTMNATIDQSVSLNIDGMQMTQGLSYAMGFFDMAQVEVLKGPQALFFGKASPAGVISVRSADPTDQFEAMLRYGYESESRNNQEEFVLSGPVTDTLRVRLAASYSDAEGYFKNVGQAANLGPLPVPLLSLFDGIFGAGWGAGASAAYGPMGSFGAADPTSDRVPSTQNTMIRATAIWQPNDQFDARLKLNHARLDMEGAGWDVQNASCPDGTAISNANFHASGLDFLGGGEDCRLDRTTRVVALDPAMFPGIPGLVPGVFNNGVPFNSTDQDFGTLEMNFRLTPSLTLSSITGYYDLSQRNMMNGSGSTYIGPVFAVEGAYQREDFTEELRLTSDYTDRPVNFMVGAYYQTGTQDFEVNLPTNLALSQLLGFFSNLPGSVSNPHGYEALPRSLSYGFHHIDTDSISAFGQVLWKMQPDLELGVGARWTEERRHHSERIVYPNPDIPDLARPDIGSDTWSPEVSLTYTPTDNLTFFGNVKQAYKSGSFITSGLFVDGEDASFNDERVRGVEIGMKSRWFDGDLRFEIAGYYYEYADLQVGSNETSPAGNYIIYTRNAASATSHGVDIDVTYSPHQVEGLTLNGGLNWNIAEFDKFDNAPCWGGQTISQGCNIDLPGDGLVGGTDLYYDAQDLSGHPLMRAPEWSVNLAADYERHISNGMTLALGASTQYNSDYLTNIAGRSDMIQDAYFKTNASIALRGPNDGWELSLIGNNIGDEITTGTCINGNYTDGTQRLFNSIVTGGATTGAGGVEELLCSPEPGREVWVRLTLRPSEWLHH